MISSAHSERKSLWDTITCTAGTAADRRNQYWFVAAMAAWAGSYIAASWALRDSTMSGPAAWSVALLPIVFGLAPLFAYLRFLRQADEMLRKIQFEGLAFGFGAGIVFSIGYELLASAGAPALPPSATAAVMLVSWSIGQLVGWRRYR